MSDDDKKTTQEPDEDVKDVPAEEQEEPAEEPQTEEPEETPAEEPQAEAEDDKAVSSSTPAAEAGSDKFGRPLFTATCSQCGKTAEVPFKPAPDRPVYCQDCYRAKKPKREFGGNGGGGRYNAR